MTGRERLTAVIERRPTDRLAWSALIDETTRSGMSPAMRDMPMTEFYRHIRCDLMPFGNFAVQKEARVVYPARAVWPDVRTTTENAPDATRTVTRHTQWGPLTAAYRGGHPIKHPVETVEEARILRNLWESMRYELAPRAAASYAALDRLIGDDGIWTQTLPPSPVQQLIEYEMGLEHFYGLLTERPDEVEGLLAVMNARRREEYELTAKHSPAPVVISVENTSSALTSPAYYRRYSLPHLRDFMDIMRAGGKKAILHMCGHLKALLPVIRETGLDGIHALTAPPLGDTPWELALDVIGDHLILMPGLTMTLFNRPGATAADVRRRMESLITPRIRRSHVVLLAGADGTPLREEFFYAVRDWVEQNG